MKVKFKRLPHGEDLPLPFYATEGSAGMDICAAEHVNLEQGERMLVSTGIAVEIEPGYEIQVRPRSGLAFKQGISIVNSPGTVDSDYRGELKINLVNLSDQFQILARGERIAQLVLAPVVQAQVEEVDELSETSRGQGGFGSTGR